MTRYRVQVNGQPGQNVEFPDDATKGDVFYAMYRHAAAGDEPVYSLSVEEADASPRADGWQPIDSAPKDGTKVLVFVERDGHRERDDLRLERDSAREQFDKHVEWASSQLAEAQQEIARLTTLAGIGTWHAECRPNRQQAAETIAKQQTENNKLADKIASLRASDGRLREALRRFGKHNAACASLQPAASQYHALRMSCNCGLESALRGGEEQPYG